MTKNRFDSLPSVSQFDEDRWVDYFELVCLSDLDLSLNKGMLIDRFKLKQNDGVDSSIEESEFSFFSDEEDMLSNGGNTATIDEKDELRCEKYFNHFRNRAHIFGDFYPFEIEKNELRVKEDYAANAKSQLYIYLLCCSCLKYFKDYQSTFTSDFEEISFRASKNMFPKSAITHLLGKTTSGFNRVYSGNVYSKFKQLAEDLNANLLVEKSDFAKTSSGDGGLDIVSWFSFRDRRNSIPVYAVQCKCSSDWVNAASPSSRLEGIINLDHSPFNLFFIPFSYQNEIGNWSQKHQLKGKIVIDRLRICRLLEDNADIFYEFKASEHINSFLTERDSII